MLESQASFTASMTRDRYIVGEKKDPQAVCFGDSCECLDCQSSVVGILSHISDAMTLQPLARFS